MHVGPGKTPSITDFPLDVIPSGVVDAVAKGGIRQVLRYSVRFGFARTRQVGNGVATAVVAAWCGELDEAQMKQPRGHQTPEQTAEPEVVLDARQARLAA